MEYFGQLYTAKPLSGQLFLAGLQMAARDPPIDETPPFRPQIRELVNKLKGGKTSKVCNKSAEMLNAVGEAMIHRVHAMLSAL